MHESQARFAKYSSEIDAQVNTPIECLATHQADVLGVVGEEVEAGLDDEFHLALASLWRSDSRLEAFEPVAQ